MEKLDHQVKKLQRAVRKALLNGELEYTVTRSHLDATSEIDWWYDTEIIINGVKITISCADKVKYAVCSIHDDLLRGMFSPKDAIKFTKQVIEKFNSENEGDNENE